MDGVTFGNADTLATLEPKRNGWFIGRFIDTDAYRQTHDVEVKWGRHNKGECHPFAANKTARTMSVLISGTMRLRFRRGEELHVVTLKDPGDFAVWLPCLDHDSEFLEECVVLTVRWPSVPDDQIESR
jgi:hypothetical protein